MIEFTDANFKTEVLESTSPVLVDFWAPWCGPCRQLAPTVDTIAADFDGRVVVGKLNTDNSQQIPAEYNVHAIPCLLLFKNGVVVDKQVGMVPRDRIAAMLNKHLGG